MALVEQTIFTSHGRTAGITYDDVTGLVVGEWVERAVAEFDGRESRKLTAGRRTTTPRRATFMTEVEFDDGRRTVTDYQYQHPLKVGGS
jgi:hypothetical protein